MGLRSGVGRQEEQPCALGPYRGLCGLALVGSEIVENDDITLFQRRRELRFDIGLEDVPVHRRVDDESCEPMTAQPGDEGLRFPGSWGGQWSDRAGGKGPISEA
jgi:hypothetical protein